MRVASSAARASPVRADASRRVELITPVKMIAPTTSATATTAVAPSVARARMERHIRLPTVAGQTIPRATDGFDRVPPERAIPAGSDLRLYAAAGVPTLHYGPGDLHLAHGPLERVPVDELVTAARAFALLTLRTCGVA